MKKIRSDASWAELPAEHLKKLDNWLFDEGLSYADALPKAQSEIGFKGSLASLKRYYQCRSKERVMEQAAQESPGDVNALRVANIKMAGVYAYQQLLEAPEDVKKWGPALKLMVDNDHNEALRELRSEAHEIRREALAFAKEKYHCELIERAMRALPALLELREARKDPNLKRYEHNARWNKARVMMFGSGSQVLPENAKEETEMLTARKERGEKGLEEDRIIEVQPPPSSSPYHKGYIEEKEKKERKETDG